MRAASPKSQKAYKPSRKTQLAIILLVKLADATAYMQIYPYVNQMVEELHIARNKAAIGYASGMVLHINRTDIYDLSMGETFCDSTKRVELLSDPSRRRIIGAGFCLTFFGVGFESLFALWNYTPIHLGGLGRETQEIGLLLSTAAIFGMALSGFVFHRLERRFGSLTLFITGMSMWSINFIAMPIISALVRTPGESADDAASPQLKGVWFAALGVLLVAKMASLAFPAYLLIVREAAPDPGSVGTVFGLAQTASSIGKCIAPAFMS
ncbi:hypothetical protein FRC04_003882 [Tulasnella sp. 424]|nr:hypothetical protein FRC04_003882 [Tulasnella sp. 424]